MHSRHILIILSLIAAVAALALVVSAGNPDNPPGPPETTSSYRLEDIYRRLSTGAAGTQITFTEPISGPSVGTGHTLDEIMAVAPQVDDTNGATTSQVASGRTYWGLQSGAWGLQTGAAPAGSNVTGGDGQLTFAIPDGFYTGSKTATAQDADLAAGNIRAGASIFGVSGDPNVVNTASGDAAAENILSGRVAWVDGIELTGSMPNNGAVTLTPTTTQQTIAAGYHDGNGYVVGDTDLISGNITSGVNLFGVDGAYPLMPLPKTGQTQCYTSTAGSATSCPAAGYPGQDGDYQAGVTWPTSRFITGTTGTTGVTVVVTDTLTGLVWLQDTNCMANQYPEFDNDNDPADTIPLGSVTWQHALEFVAGITVTGQYSNCAAGFSDWRLPNSRELESLLDYGGPYVYPAPPDDLPFTGVTYQWFWSSTTETGVLADTSWARAVLLYYNFGGPIRKDSEARVWPVRGGQ